MSYLYGDSTPSTLAVNFIELLRDAVDCCVQILLADQRIAEGATRTRALDAATAAEITKLQKIGGLVPKAFEGTPVGEPGSAAGRCVAAIVRSAAEIVRAATAEATATLESAVGRRDAEAAVEREGCVKALETLLIKHDLPDMKSDLDVALVGGTRYVCRARLMTAFGLVAVVELEVPPGHLLERIVRVDRLAERLEVQVPEMAGWLHKEVKLRAQHLEKHHLIAFARRGTGTELRLRVGPDGTGAGYDIIYAEDGEPIRLVRVDDQQKHEEPFDAQASDVAKLVALRDKVAAAAAELERHRTKILDAKLEGETLANHTKPSLLVERIIAQLAPEAREIAARSQSTNELVLRRSLGGDRREEIFLSKQDLKAKIEPLKDRSRALFDALLDGASTTRAEPPVASLPRTEPPAAPAAPAPDGLGGSLLRKTLSPTVIPTGGTPAKGVPSRAATPLPTATPTGGTPAAGVPARPATPLYGVPTLASQASMAAHTSPTVIPPQSPSPPMAAHTSPTVIPPVAPPPPKSGTGPSAEPASASGTNGDISPRKTATVATTLDRPPPVPSSTVSGEIGGATPEKKRTEQSGPNTAP